ncbi:MAG: hypothetical protein K1060chlam1_00584 [Candidatus Anoxychlamydiales bacterium]|nr:hypothetical protein [Candidatus Anoxychlamydiales bacterium]
MKFKNKYLVAFLFLLIFSSPQNKLFAEVKNAKNPKITTILRSNYVYDVWIKNDGVNDRIQTARSQDYGSNWDSPIYLSAADQDASSFSLGVDSLEKDLFAIWVRSNGTNDIVQFSSTLNYGQPWDAPIDLSLPNQDASSPDIVSDFIGEKIYTIWARSNGTNDIIQFSKSLDFGQTFSTPIDLSATLQNAKTPKIATSFAQNCICTIWERSNGTNDVIQFKHSSDFGNTWDSVVDLSETVSNARNPQVLTNGSYIYTIWEREKLDEAWAYGTEFRKSMDSGTTFSDVYGISPYVYSVNKSKMVCSNDAQYIYVSWYISNGMYTDAQVVVSKDYGYSFDGAFILNNFGKNCIDTDIATDINGQNTYIVWARSNGTNDIIQLGKSNDYGAHWTNIGHDLSLPGQDAKNPSVKTSDSGDKVFVIWARSDGTKDVIEEVYSNDYGASFSIPQTVSN